MSTVVLKAGCWERGAAVEPVLGVCGGEYEPLDIRAEQARGMIGSFTAWQRVLHGETDRWRSVMVDLLLEDGGSEKAWRYAACGRGDELVRRVDGSLGVKPLCCGSAVCPRCSRKRGVRFARRVREHLARAPHGRLEHVVFTQLVIRGESLASCSDRFEKRWNRMRGWWSRRGLSAGLLTIHTTWSRFGGWHLHGHLLCEVEPGGADGAAALGWWRDQCSAENPERDTSGAGFVRVVVQAGGPLVVTDFHADAVDAGAVERMAVCRALDYPLKDVYQGVATRAMRNAPEAALRELVSCVKRLRRHRLIGRWRAKAPEAAATGNEAAVAAVPTMGESLGRLDVIRESARSGDWFAAALLREFESGYSGPCASSVMFVAFCRAAVSL